METAERVVYVVATTAEEAARWHAFGVTPTYATKERAEIGRESYEGKRWAHDEEWRIYRIDITATEA